MISEDERKAATEIVVGENYERTWNTYVKPFFTLKQQDLFDAFMETGSDDVERLQNIRMQSSVLEAMENHFMEFINTGKLAQQQLGL